MSELIRYTETFSGMEPDDIGDWVTFDDAKALQDEIAARDFALEIAAYKIDKLAQRLAEVEKLLEVSECPASCIDGAYHGHDGEPIQCQFCYERKQALSNSEGGSDDA